MKQKPIHFDLRPAVQEDIEFMFQLRSITMKPFFEHTLGWNDRDEYHKAADELDHSKIVMVGNEAIGVVKLIPQDDELHLHQLQVSPAYQKMGIGAKLLSQAVSRSDALQLPITLLVITESPAKRLYDSFGFVVTETHEHHCKMRREPAKRSQP